MGVSKNFETPLDISKTGYISIKIKADLPEEAATANVMLRLIGKKADGTSVVVYEGVSPVRPSEWHDLTFKLTDYAGEILSVDVMKIWVKTYNDKIYEGDYGLWIENILIYSKSNINILSVILWLILIIVIILIVGFIALVARNQIRYRLKQRRQKQRAMQKEAMRRNQLHAQQRTLPPEQNNQSQPQDQPEQKRPQARRKPPESK